ncbi:hypothetical protein HNY73_004048 [Argiope bruennichi]|uniref:Uncharacterized protein n=1 Tax=Argiope bruennichi TaxID=94029 RepID=A0A8T0FNI7_ARGBR|nr:hypothetical protein HNY73_004048 [Argiope bruennichi]
MFLLKLKNIEYFSCSELFGAIFKEELKKNPYIFQELPIAATELIMGYFTRLECGSGTCVFMPDTYVMDCIF